MHSICPLGILYLIHLFVGNLDSINDIEAVIKDCIKCAAAGHNLVREVSILIEFDEDVIDLLYNGGRIAVADYYGKYLVTAETC